MRFKLPRLVYTERKRLRFSIYFNVEVSMPQTFGELSSHFGNIFLVNIYFSLQGASPEI